MLLQAILRIETVKLAGRKFPEASNLNFLKCLKNSVKPAFFKMTIRLNDGSHSLCKPQK